MVIPIHTIRIIVVAVSLLFLAVAFLKEKQSAKLNWSIFYASLWVFINLGVINYACVKLNYWQFIETNSITMPYDLYFIWFVIWGILPIYLFKGRHLWIIAIGFFWMDILLMPTNKME